MADSLPSPPTSRSSTPDSETARVAFDELTAQLDRLLEQYLELLDHYSTLQEELSKTFSVGFLSLANAQRTANLGAGRRYGQEGYDGRMKALRHVVTETEKRTQKERSVVATDEKYPINREQRYICTVSLHKSASILEIKSTSSKDSTLGVDTTTGDNDASSKTVIGESLQNDKKPDPAYRDPAAWFGILVPQQLRQTQKCFTAAVETTVPSLVNIKSSMCLLEQHIWQIRKALGIEEQYSEVNDIVVESSSDPMEKIDKLLAKAKLSSNHLQ